MILGLALTFLLFAHSSWEHLPSRSTWQCSAQLYQHVADSKIWVYQIGKDSKTGGKYDDK
jgi:hypothetical protein